MRFREGEGGSSDGEGEGEEIRDREMYGLRTRWVVIWIQICT